jgi:hypothetical protein
MSNPHSPGNQFFSRRDALKASTAGFGMLALSGLCAEQAAADYNSPLSPKAPHFPPKAKRVIFLCMRGGPAQTDTFDYKPIKDAPVVSAPKTKTTGKKGKYRGGGRAGSAVKFKKFGQSGLWMSEAFGELGKHADEMCLINSMHTNVPNHPQSFLMMHTGEFRFARPSVGSWVLYGLGSQNENLPGFITINPPTRVGGAQNYASGFLPAIYQGTSLGHIGAPIDQAKIGHVKSDHLPPGTQRKQLDLVQAMNRQHLARRKVDAKLEGVIESLELGFRMQSAVPEVMDISREPQSVQDMYAVGKSVKQGRSLNDDFGRQCLMARRLAEAGVRYIEVCHSNWDQHGNHRADIAANSKAIDRPIAALLTDLKQRDMLKDTLVVWGGEFGRTPLSANGKNSSGHNSAGFTYWMAGGGVKGGMTHGMTDATGRTAVEDKVHIHDLHATMLHLLGLDHTRLTYRHSGRDFRLTNIYGNVVKEIIA